MVTYKEKIAHLTSLIVQIKRYSSEMLNDILNIDEVERLLDLPEISDRDWENDTLENQRIFMAFLNTHISVYENALRQIATPINIPYSGKGDC